MNFKMPNFLANNIVSDKCKVISDKLTQSHLLFTLRFSLFTFLLFASSCLSHKELINFRTGEEKLPTLVNMPKQDILNQADMKLQTSDVLAIIIASPDGGILATPYNIGPAQSMTQSLTANSPTTFLIGSDGFIDLPTIGRLKAAGLTAKEVRDEIVKLVSKDILNPSVNVRLINFKISVTGEVASPGVFPIENERVTILEALAKAGGLTAYSNRRHVMIIREKNGIREIGEIDFKDTKLFASPYYFLQQNDMIYVEPTKGKIAQIQQPINAYLQPIGAGLSILAFLIALFKK
jgi:polysaccharide biosynthesis/export protein